MESIAGDQRFAMAELIAAFFEHAESYSVKDGESTKTIANIRIACQRLEQLYTSISVDEFGPGQFRAFRETWICDGKNQRTVNYKTNWMKHRFRWGVEHELVYGETWHRINAVSSLRRGRSNARPAGIRGLVPRADVDETLEHLPQVVADTTDARPCRLRELMMPRVTG